MESPNSGEKQPGSGRAWINLVIAALLMLATLPGRTQGLGLITEPLLGDMRLDRITYAQINLWATLLGALACFPAGYLLDRFGLRYVSTGLALLLGAVVWQMGRFAGNAAGLFILILLTRALGQSALSVASITAAGKSFGKRMGFAMGIYSFLLSVFFVIAFVVLGNTISQHGWRNAWAQIAVMLVFVIAPLTFICFQEMVAEASSSEISETITASPSFPSPPSKEKARVRGRDERGEEVDQFEVAASPSPQPSPPVGARGKIALAAALIGTIDASPEKHANEKIPTSKNDISDSLAKSDVAAVDFTLPQALRTLTFWIFGGATALFGLVSSGLGLFNEAVLAERGFNRDTFHIFLAVTTFAGLLGQLLCGWLALRQSLRRLMGVAMVLYAAALAILPFVKAFAQLWTFAVLVGAAGGFITVIFFAIWSHAFGRGHLGRIQGAAQILTVLASAIGPLLFAKCAAVMGSYTPLLLSLAVLVLGFGVAAWNISLPKLPEECRTSLIGGTSAQEH